MKPPDLLPFTWPLHLSTPTPFFCHSHQLPLLRSFTSTEPMPTPYSSLCFVSPFLFAAEYLMPPLCNPEERESDLATQIHGSIGVYAMYFGHSKASDQAFPTVMIQFSPIPWAICLLYVSLSFAIFADLLLCIMNCVFRLSVMSMSPYWMWLCCRNQVSQREYQSACCPH